MNRELAPQFGDDVGWFDTSGVEALQKPRMFAVEPASVLVKEQIVDAGEVRVDYGLPYEKPTGDTPAVPDGPVDNVQTIADPVTPADFSATGSFPASSVAHANRAAIAVLPRKAGPVDASIVHRYLAQNYPERVLSWVDRAQWTYRPAVPLDSIDMARRPGGRDQGKVAAIADAVTAGKPMEPVVLVDVDGKLQIADGYHRTLAFQRAGKTSVAAYVATGTRVTGPWVKTMHAAKLNRADDVIAHIERLTERRALARYDTSPVGTPGGKKNWVDEVNGLPLFIRAIAHALIRDGHSESSAIAIAVGRVKAWAAGGGHVTAKTRAKAAAAVAEWEAKKAASHAS